MADGPPAGLLPYDRALRAFFFDGRRDAVMMLHSDLGEHDVVPLDVFFREAGGFFPFEEAALDACRGAVLELGAGSGSDALALQDRGLQVTAVDVVPAAVEIMRAREVRHVIHADYRTLDADPVDTVLILMNGAGWAGTLEGLSAFLAHARRFVRPGGQLLLDGGGPERPRVEDGLMEWPPRTGDFHGEAWIRLEFDGEVGEPFRELYVDFETLAARARAAGWFAQPIYHGEMDSFVARLVLDRP